MEEIFWDRRTFYDIGRNDLRALYDALSTELDTHQKRLVTILRLTDEEFRARIEAKNIDRERLIQLRASFEADAIGRAYTKEEWDQAKASLEVTCEDFLPERLGPYVAVIELTGEVREDRRFEFCCIDDEIPF